MFGFDPKLSDSKSDMIVHYTTWPRSTCCRTGKREIFVIACFVVGYCQHQHISIHIRSCFFNWHTATMIIYNLTTYISFHFWRQSLRDCGEINAGRIIVNNIPLSYSYSRSVLQGSSNVLRSDIPVSNSKHRPALMRHNCGNGRLLSFLFISVFSII